ncbi:MAG: hypothetical protein JWN52_91 [Actinomycetia bacterium]|nr:hypothetical protein [Actinomycetes bacterium]
MTIHDFATALRRNLVVALIMVVLTLVVALRAVTASPTYQAQNVLTFLSPEAPFPRNSYASFTPDLVLMADVSATVLSSDPGRQAVRKAGGTADYQVVLFNRGSQELPIHDQPYLTVSASAKSSGEAQQTLLAVLEVLRLELKNRQLDAGAVPGSLITWRITKSTGNPIPTTGQPSRELLAILILGLIGTVYAAVLADRFGVRVRLPRRRDGARGARLSPRGAGV